MSKAKLSCLAFHGTGLKKGISMRLALATTIGICAVALNMTAAEEVWPQFRGPGSCGIGEGENLPVTWSSTRNVAWKTPIPGMGWSSPIVWGQRVFVTTVVDTGTSMEPKKGLYFGGEQKKPSEAVHLWKVLCLDLTTGKIMWDRTVHKGIPTFTRHRKNSYASATPVTDGQRVYAYFGNLGLFCFSMDGEPLWKKMIGPFKTRLGWGSGASPIVHEERLYLCNDNEADSFLMALNVHDGKELWRVPRDEKSNLATPFVWENKLRSEIVTSGSNRIRSYDMQGELLWELGGASGITICTPSSRFGLLYVASGYIADRKRPLFAVKPGATGDITLEDEQNSNDYVQWCQRRAAPYNTSPLIYGDDAYICLDQGIMACYDARTGEVVYEKKRLPARHFTASPWAYDNKVFCLDESGKTFVIKAGPEFEVLHANQLDEETMCLATPAMVGDRLLIRTDRALYCLQKGATREEPNDDQNDSASTVGEQ